MKRLGLIRKPMPTNLNEHEIECWKWANGCEADGQPVPGVLEGTLGDDIAKLCTTISELRAQVMESSAVQEGK